MNAWGNETLICYRGACQKPAHPCGYNRVTHGLYCLDCAHKIESMAVRLKRVSPGVRGTDGLFPLLEYAPALPEGGEWRSGVIRVFAAVDKNEPAEWLKRERERRG